MKIKRQKVERVTITGAYSPSSVFNAFDHCKANGYKVVRTAVLKRDYTAHFKIVAERPTV